MAQGQSIGDPWWDYWFPIDQLVKNSTVYVCPSYIMLHLDHTLSWNQEVWLHNAQRFLNIYQVGSEVYGKSFNQKYNALIGHTLSGPDLDRFSADVFEVINKNKRNSFEVTDSVNGLLMEVFKTRFGPVNPLNKFSWPKRVWAAIQGQFAS